MHFLIVALLSVPAWQPASAEIDDQAKSQMLETAIAAWERRSQAFREFTISYAKSVGQDRSTTRRKLQRRDDHYLYGYETASDTPRLGVKATNPRYSFEISRKDGGSWILKSFCRLAEGDRWNTVDDSGVTKWCIGTPRAIFQTDVCIGSIGAEPLVHYIRDDDFAVTSISPRPDGDIEFVMKYVGPPAQAPFAKFMFARFVARPRLQWALVESEFGRDVSEGEYFNSSGQRLANHYVVKMTMEYDDRKPFPAVRKTTLEFVQDGWGEVHRYEVDNFEFTAPPVSEFLLEHHGLAEPGVGTRRHGRGWTQYALYGVGLLLLALAGWLGWKYQS